MISQTAFEFILWRSLASFLLVGALAGIAVSLLLIYRPATFERVNRAASHWISTRRISRMADSTLSLEQWFFRHHRAMGAFFTVGAVYIFAYFGLMLDKAAALRNLPGQLPIRLPLPLLEGLLDALVLTALTGAAAALVVGLLLWLRPSMLRGLEESGNQWLTLRKATKFLDVPRDQMDEFVLCHNQRIGWLLLLGSLTLMLLVLRILA